MRRTRRRKLPHKAVTHTHTWEIPRDEEGWEPDGEFLRIYEYCQWVQITNSVTDDKRDETYYETGAECGAVRTTIFKQDDRIVDTDGEPLLDDATKEEVFMRAHEKAAETAMTVWRDWKAEGAFDRGPHEVPVMYEDTEYLVTYRFHEQRVREDWK